jgi:ADP-heptose:LPS heptosyltransferase
MSRILIVRAGALGDVLLLRPVVASLRRAHIDVTLMAPARSGSVLVGDGSDDAQRLLVWDGCDVARLLLAGDGADDAARRETFGTYDAVLCYSRSPEIAPRLAALSDRVIAHDPTPRSGHAADWLAQPLSALGIPQIVPSKLTPLLDEADRALLGRLPDRFLAIHPGSGSPRKNWPADRFAALATRLSNGLPWLLSLGPADEAEAAALRGTASAVTTRDLPPRRLGALLSRAGLYIGNDSGVSHLAAACGVATVALFGPTDPKTWAPLGPRVRAVKAEDEDLRSLNVDEVRRVAVTLADERSR